MDQQPVGPVQNYDDIDMQTLISEYQTAKTYTDNYTKDFPSLDSLVDAVPITQEKDAPYVGDTTLAGLVRSIPRDSLQQLPIFAARVNGSKYSKQAVLASFILRKGVFNEDTFGKGLLSTMQVGTEQALTHGYAPFMTATGSMFDEFGTTMRMLHYADCAPEPGISDANEAGCFYVVANLTKTRLRKILNAATNNPSTSWNVEALQRLVEMQPQTHTYSIYQSSARNKKSTENAPTYQFITRYETGKGGKFVTFSPQIEDMPLRVITNKSKFGYPRVQFLVIDPDALSPFGVSRVRLASPNQNLMNVYYQNIASMLLLNSKPPVFKRGRFTKPVQLTRGAIWEALDPNAVAELKTMDNGALQTFPAISKQMSAQISTMMGKPTQSLDYGNTSPGAKATIKKEDSSTNQVTNLLENFLRQYGLVALDTYISEQTGDVELTLDDEAKDALNRIIPEAVGDDNKIHLNWEEFYDGIESLGVEIELSIGKDELEEKTRADLQDMLTVMTQNLPDPSDPNYQAQRAKVTEIEDRLLEKTIPESKRITPVMPTAPVQPQPVETQVSDQVTANTMSQ